LAYYVVSLSHLRLPVALVRLRPFYEYSRGQRLTRANRGE
jgi:hypothetical protein